MREMTTKAAAEAPRQTGPREFVVIASDETVDHYGDRILCTGEFLGRRFGDGWDLSVHQGNPVLLAFHQHGAPAVGTVKAWRDDAARRLMARVQFADTAAGRELAELYAQRVMRAFSVGFRPRPGGVVEPRSEAERKAWGLGRDGVLFASQTLLELSAVTVPANPAALTLDEAKGYGRAADVLAAEGLREAAMELRSLLPSGRSTCDLGALDAAAERVSESMRDMVDTTRAALGLAPIRGHSASDDYVRLLRRAAARERQREE